MTFAVTSTPTPPTVFNLQASDWVHWCTYWYILASLEIGTCFLQIFKVIYFAPPPPPKNTSISNNSINFIIPFFLKKRYSSIRIYLLNAKTTSNFLISLKSYEEQAFPSVLPNAGLFSITRFLYGWQKIFLNKNIFSKHDLHVSLYYFSLKWTIKKIIYQATIPLKEYLIWVWNGVSYTVPELSLIYLGHYPLLCFWGDWQHRKPGLSIC